MKRHVKKNDVVVVISGVHHGKRGKILAVYPGKQRILIEGVNIIKKHMRKTQDRPKGEIVSKEGTVHISNVMKADVYDGSRRRAKAEPAPAA